MFLVVYRKVTCAPDYRHFPCKIQALGVQIQSVYTVYYTGCLKKKGLIPVMYLIVGNTFWPENLY